MRIKKIIWLWILEFIGLLSKVEAVSLWTLRWHIGSEFSQDPTRIEGNRSVFDLIRFVNSYIWFGIWFVCFLFMVINGYKLITAHGDEKKTKKINYMNSHLPIGLHYCKSGCKIICIKRNISFIIGIKIILKIYLLLL